MNNSPKRRDKNAEFPSIPATPIMPEIHNDLMVVIPQITSSDKLKNVTSNTWQIVIGGRDFRFTCSNDLSRIRIWAFENSLRWNIQVRLEWAESFGVSLYNTLRSLNVVNAQGDVEEIKNDLLVLRLAS